MTGAGAIMGATGITGATGIIGAVMGAIIGAAYILLNNYITSHSSDSSIAKPFIKINIAIVLQNLYHNYKINC